MLKIKNNTTPSAASSRRKWNAPPIGNRNPSPAKWGFPASAPNSRAVHGMVPALFIVGIGLLFIGLRIQRQTLLNAALITAVEQGQTTGAEDLLRQGADADTAKPWFRSIPPSFEQWRWFRENISDKGNAPEPVLCLAAEKHDLAMVDILLAHGANINRRSCHDYTALAYASGDTPLTRDLLRQGANPNAEDVFGDPALPTAARSNTPKMGTNK